MTTATVNTADHIAWLEGHARHLKSLINGGEMDSKTRTTLEGEYGGLCDAIYILKTSKRPHWWDTLPTV